VVADMPRDTWIPIVVHMVTSRQRAGQVQVWVGNDATQDTPSYSATDINFGFGNWDGDTLLSSIAFKFGQYNYDYENYTPGEVRTTYYDNLHIIPMAHSDGWRAVHPARDSFAYSGAALGASTQRTVVDYAFDNTVNTNYWMGYGPSGWLQYRFPDRKPTRITRYALVSGTSSAARDPRNWVLLGSQDGQMWETLDFRSNQTFASRSLERSFDVANPGAYVYYRLRIDANNGDAGFTHLGDLRLTP